MSTDACSHARQHSEHERQPVQILLKAARVPSCCQKPFYHRVQGMQARSLRSCAPESRRAIGSTGCLKFWDLENPKPEKTEGLGWAHDWGTPVTGCESAGCSAADSCWLSSASARPGRAAARYSSIAQGACADAHSPQTLSLQPPQGFQVCGGAVVRAWQGFRIKACLVRVRVLARV